MEAVAVDDCLLAMVHGPAMVEVLDLYPVMYRSLDRISHLFRIFPRFCH